MSMSSYVKGVRLPDERWRQMKQVWDACVAAHVEPPDEVDRFFNGEPPDQVGVVLDLTHTDAVTEYHADMKEGFEVDIAKLPEGVQIIRFVNSY
jgi:hypothetical protein